MAETQVLSPVVLIPTSQDLIPKSQLLFSGSIGYVIGLALMMLRPWCLLVLLSTFLHSANTLPTGKARPRSRPAIRLANSILFNQATNASESLSLPLDATATNQEPVCFENAWLPLIDLEDCNYAMQDLDDDTLADAPFRQPVTWTASHSWVVGTCAILLAQFTVGAHDTFPRIDIARKALDILDFCEHDPHGLRGGYLGIGNEDFRVVVRRPLPSTKSL